MTFELATYYKILLICGYNDELRNYIDDAIINQDPISDIVLDLSLVVYDNKKLLSVLNKYLLKATEIDYDVTVFNLIMHFLKDRYTSGESIKHLTKLMYKIALCTERELDEPWQTMYYLGDFYEEAECGYFNKEDFMQKFDAFINNKICLSEYPEIAPKESFVKTLFTAIKLLFHKG